MFFRSLPVKWNRILPVLTVWAGVSSCTLKEQAIPAVNLSITESQVNTGFEDAALSGTFSCNFTAEDLILEYSKDPSLSSATRMTAHSPKGTVYFVLYGLDIQTTYYYRYTVSNSINSVVDGQIRQFKTHDYTVPEVQTLSASSVTGTKAVLSGSLGYTCKKEILSKGFLCGKKGEEMKTFPVTGADFTLELNDLEMGTQYVFQAFAESEIGTGYGETLTFTTYPPVKFSAIEVSDIKMKSAVVTGGISSDGGVSIQEKGIRYRPVGSEETATLAYAESVVLSGLTASTQYEVWFFANREDGQFESDHYSFQTAAPVSFLPVSVSDITYSSAVFTGGIQSDGGVPILEKGVKFGVVGSGSPAIISYSSNIPKSVSISGFTPSTQYEVWYFATTEEESFESEHCLFKTAGVVSFSPITVSDIQKSSATVSGGILDEAGYSIVEKGIKYRPAGSGDPVKVAYAESVVLSDLTASTQYEVWYYAQTDKDLFESEHSLFTTADDVLPEFLDGVFSVAADKKVSFSRGISGPSLALQQFSLGGEKYMYPIVIKDDSILSSQEWKYLVSERPNAADLFYLNVTVHRVAGALLLPDNWNNTELHFQNDSTIEDQDFLDAQELGAVFIPYTGSLVDRHTYMHDYTTMLGVGDYTIILTGETSKGEYGVRFTTTGVKYNDDLTGGAGNVYESYTGVIRRVKVR